MPKRNEKNWDDHMFLLFVYNYSVDKKMFFLVALDHTLIYLSDVSISSVKGVTRSDY